jgi:predicted metal-dependent hydrolase
LSSKVIKYNSVGEIQLKKTHRSRGMSLKIHPVKGICVSIPYYWTYKDAEVILKENRDWVENSIKKLSALEKKTNPFTEKTDYKTKFHSVKILPWPGEDISYTLKNQLLTIYFPSTRNILDRDIQEAIRFRIEETLRKEAKEYLPLRVESFASKMNFKYKKVTIKNMKSRWGSCSASNQINLSLHLLRIPEELCDYVILHELCHTVHKNHGKKFWDLLSSVCPQAKAKDKEMRNYDALRY